ncbi:MAG: NAD(P)H-dependent oxidoreductase [Christensenella sp.]|nr:NAD(P)H-dependent oxidoreductase [Christensenella sp.]
MEEKKTLLFIDSCIRGKEDSRTHRLCDAYLRALSDASNAPEIQNVSLAELQLSPLTTQDIETRDMFIKAGEFSAPMFGLARQFAVADHILIGAPYWDLSFPAALKTYIEHIMVNGITFKYTDSGRQVGLCRAKSLAYITTAGGSISSRNFGYEYLRSISQMLGIESMQFLSAENLDIEDVDEEVILKTKMHEARKLASEVR